MNTMAGLYSITMSILNVSQEYYEIIFLWAKLRTPASGAWGVAHQVQTLAIKPDDLSSIPDPTW